jgi:hypothetical protein
MERGKSVAKSYAKVVIIARCSATVQYPLGDRGYATFLELRACELRRTPLPRLSGTDSLSRLDFIHSSRVAKRFGLAPAARGAREALRSPRSRHGRAYG